MAIQNDKTLDHWKYFLAIEDDVEHLSRYVEFNEENYDCYSIEILRILVISAAEVDVVCKQICKALNDQPKAGRIDYYRKK